MFGGSAYLFAIVKYFPSLFFCLLLLQRNFFPLRFRQKNSATKLRYLRSSAFYSQRFWSCYLLWHDGYCLMGNTNVCCHIPSHPIGMTFLRTVMECHSYGQACVFDIWTKSQSLRKYGNGCGVLGLGLSGRYLGLGWTLKDLWWGFRLRLVGQEF